MLANLQCLPFIKEVPAGIGRQGLRAEKMTGGKQELGGPPKVCAITSPLGYSVMQMKREKGTVVPTSGTLRHVNRSLCAALGGEEK